MKKYLILLGVLPLWSICFAQNDKDKDSIQLYYYTGRVSVSNSRQNHCVTIVFDGDSMVLSRKCFVSNYNSKCGNIGILQFDMMLTFGFDRERYDKLEKECVLCNYMENKRCITLDEGVQIDKYQLNEFVKILNEIKLFASKTTESTDELSLAYNNQYVIIDKSEISFIFDYEGAYDRSMDVERALGLKRFSRCPCREIEIKEAKKQNEKAKEKANKHRKYYRKRGNDSLILDH